MSTSFDTALMKITPRPLPVMACGAGSFLWDEAGKRYLDFIQGWAVNSLGHAAPEVSAALAEQAARLVTPSPALHNRPQLELAELLVAGSDFAQVHFANSGAEANEAAVKLARKWGQLHRAGAAEILTTDGAFHGRTLAMMAASGKPNWDTMFPPRAPGFRRVPFGDLDATAAAIGPQTVALMLEPIQGEAGVVVPPAGYLAGLRALADRHGLLLILDEIQTGVGRTGTFFGFEHEGVRPDLLTLGKGIGGGVPLSAVLATADAACFEFGEQGGTYNGNPLMCAVGNAVVSTVRDADFLAGVVARGVQMRIGLERLAECHSALEVRGRGLLWALRLRDPIAEQVVTQAMTAGLLINAARPDVLRFMPSLRVTAAEVQQMLAILGSVLQAVTAAEVQ